jgi:phospholipid/cholesterol/gamma-HCH transport system substrate-binding protein
MMEPRREQAFVGLFVIIAGGLLIATVFALSGAFGRTAKTYHAYFPFAGGIERGTAVRYGGTAKIGRVESTLVDPKDPARIDITFSVEPEVPVKTDSHVRIMSLSPLGDNHLEIIAGNDPKATLAPPGTLLTSDPYVDFNALTAQINNIAPQAQQLIHTLNDRATELKETMVRVNDLLSPKNRDNISATIAETRGMITEDRPKIKSSLDSVTSLTKKMEPLLEDFRKTSAEANTTLEHIDGTIGENRTDIHQAVLQLRKILNSANDLTDRLNTTLDANSDNLDEMLDNLRHVTENLKEFTDTIKKRPYTLIRASNPHEHKTGDPK